MQKQPKRFDLSSPSYTLFGKETKRKVAQYLQKRADLLANLFSIWDLPRRKFAIGFWADPKISSHPTSRPKIV
jgi:hypothetical protein